MNSSPDSLSLNLKDITVVILSYNRQHCLRTVIEFYSNYNLRVLVIDNSSKQLDDSEIPWNCKYIYSQSDYRSRAEIAINLIESPYAIMAADDEIYIPSALMDMREFLELNDDYVAVGGQTMAVWAYGNLTAASWAYRNTFKYDNDSIYAFERIQYHCGNGNRPVTSFFTCNLTRSSILKNCLKAYSLSPVLATDSLSVLTICGAGKSKYIDVLYWIRNWNQSPQSHKSWNRKLSFSEWWDESEGTEAKRSFVKTLRKLTQKFISSDDFFRALEMIVESDRYYSKKSRTFKNIYVKIKEIDRLKKIMYILKKIFKPESLPNNTSKILDQMIDEDIRVNLQEVEMGSNLVSQLRPYLNW
jgi:glycosyltransferase domain-containing protein